MSNTITGASLANNFYQLQDHVWKQDWFSVLGLLVEFNGMK